MQNWGRRGWRTEEPSLTLSHGPIMRAGDNTFSTTAFVSIGGWWEGGRPRTVELYTDNGKPIELELRDGRASYPLVKLDPESHVLVTAVARGHWQETLIVVPPLPKLKQPKRLLGYWAGGPGKYIVSLSTLDEDGKPVPKVPVRLIYDARVARDIHTDENGSRKANINVPAGERWFFRATVPGSDVIPVTRWLEGA